jgi:hypothetical protein
MRDSLKAVMIAGLVGSSAVQSAMITDSASIAFSDTNWDTAGGQFSPPSAGGNLTLDLFNDQGGTLQLLSVTIIGEALARGTSTISNTGASNLVFGMPNSDVSASVRMTSNLGALNILLEPIASGTLGTGTIPSGGPDVVIDFGGGLGGAGISDIDQVVYTDAAELSNFIGVGTFTLDALAIGLQTVSLSGQGRATVEMEAAANAQVIYEYDDANTPVVPAPGAIALIGIGLVGLVVVRRRRTA